MMALSNTMNRMTPASVGSPANPAMAAATIKMMTIKSVNSSRNESHSGFFFFAMSSLCPYLVRRVFASDEERPFSVVLNKRKSCVRVFLCMGRGYVEGSLL